MDAKQIRNRILQTARNAHETSQRRPAGEKLADIELICDDLAAWAYALGYNAARDDTLTRDLARSPRWDDQPSSTKGASMKTAQYDTPAQLAYYEAVRVVDANYAAAVAVAKTDDEFRAAAWARRLTAFKAARATYEATLAEGAEQ